MFESSDLKGRTVSEPNNNNSNDNIDACTPLQRSNSSNSQPTATTTSNSTKTMEEDNITTSTSTTSNSVGSSIGNNSSMGNLNMSIGSLLSNLQNSVGGGSTENLSPNVSSPTLSSPSVKKKTIDDFVIGKTLGEGSYGAVVHGTDKDTNNQYAIKILEKKHIIKENKIKYVQIEKEILCKANHPNICKLFFTFRSENCLYYVLELCSQGDLLHQIKPVGSFSDECTRFYIAEIISALEHLHNLGIVHRDLKPENILLSSDMHIKVTDFGTGKILTPDQIKQLQDKDRLEKQDTATTTDDTQNNNGTKQRSNSFVGTAEYVSPELINNKETSTDSDLWALGCIIYQLTTGRLPFRGKTEFLTFQKVSNRDLVYPININPMVKDLIEKLLVTKPTDRLGSKSNGLGNDSFKPLKQHPFFEGIDWDNLHKQTPPKIVSPAEKIIFEESTDSLSSSTSNVNALSSSTSSPLSNSSSNVNSLSSSQQLHNSNNGITTPTNTSPRLTAERSKWAQFLQPNETILESGLVWKKKGFSIKKRQLILTSTPRILYIDPKKTQLKGEIPWSNNIKPEAKNNSNFVIQTPKRKYLLEDVDHNSQKWVDAINSALANIKLN